MNPILRQILSTGHCTTPDGRLVKTHSTINLEEGEFLQRLIREVQPQTCLEVGLAFGVSSLFLCDEMAKVPGTRLIVIDPAQNDPRWWRGLGLHNLRAAGFEPMIEFHEMPSYRALPLLERDGRRVEFAFVDGRHRFDYVMTDFFFTDKLLKVGGLMVFDDVNWPGVRKALRYIVTNENYSVHATACPDRRSRQPWSLPAPSRWLLRHRLPPTDQSLGLAARCVALRKEPPDFRPPPPNTMTNGADNSEKFAYRDF